MLAVLIPKIFKFTMLKLSERNTAQFLLPVITLKKKKKALFLLILQVVVCSLIQNGRL